MISHFYQVDGQCGRQQDVATACRLDRQPGKTMAAARAAGIEFGFGGGEFFRCPLAFTPRKRMTTNSGRKKGPGNEPGPFPVA
jgi:hypothetical protein